MTGRPFLLWFIVILYIYFFDCFNQIGQGEEDVVGMAESDLFIIIYNVLYDFIDLLDTLVLF